jgi:protoheme IX farnesyltransferase
MCEIFMETVTSKLLSSSVKTYVLLTKPGIIFGNLVTGIGGFALASQGHFNGLLALASLLGLSLIVGSGCVFNNYIDREIDKKMARTQNRAMARGLISSRDALLFGALLLLIGTGLLLQFTNLLATAIALVGFFVYVFWYSFFKYKTVHGTLIGSIAGAVPPVVGYCSVSGRLDLGAFLIFLIVVLWQMPHFFAIATYRMKEYLAAGLPLVPIVRGMLITKIQMLLYITSFIIASSLLYYFGYCNQTYLIATGFLGAFWLGYAIQGFFKKENQDKIWARKMFVISLVVIMGLSIMIPISGI